MTAIHAVGVLLICRHQCLLKCASAFAYNRPPGLAIQACVLGTGPLMVIPGRLSAVHFFEDSLVTARAAEVALFWQSSDSG